MSEVEDAAKEAVQTHEEWALNSWVAGLVAVVATCMAVGNIKDGNIVQAMQQSQARSIDAWSYYQSKSLKQLMSENAADQLETFLAITPTLSLPARDSIQKRMAKHREEAVRYDKEKNEIKKQAETFDKDYERLNIHDDQFDMSEACLTIGIALFGVSALTRKKWLFFFACSMAGVGFTLELSGFLGWAFHPEWLAKLLG
jgi:hypothetical protein